MFTCRKDLPSVLPTKKTFFCILCGATGVTKVKHKNSNFLYHCGSCHQKSERFIAWDPGMEQYFNNQNELVHASVGVIVQNEKKDILLFKRVKYPFLWTVPAGHLNKGEEPSEAALRELFEETQITITQLHPVFTGEIRGDSCVGGADIHFWHAYVGRMQNDVEPSIEKEEGGEWGWFSLDKLPEVTMPVTYLLQHKDVNEYLIS